MGRRKWLILAVCTGSMLGCTHSWLPNSGLPLSNVDPVSANSKECVPEGRWYLPRQARLGAVPTIMADLAERDVLLLGEIHDSEAHHIWQLQVIAAMHGLRGNIVIGMEMLPRSVQPILDKWVANELTPEEFLRLSNWYEYWQFDADLYMPILQFARINRIPVLAINIDRSLVKSVRDLGWAAIEPSKRSGITDPAPVSSGYLDLLAATFGLHGAHGSSASDGKSPSAGDVKTDPRFLRFVEGQSLWDRALAQGLAEAWQRDRDALVIGIMGSGHVVFGYGVANQLADLGVQDVGTAAPWDGQFDCAALSNGYADAVFGLTIPEDTAEPIRPRLGVNIENHEKGVRVVSVVVESVAAAAGILEKDLILELAGRTVRDVRQVVEQIQTTVPGTWIPLVVERAGQRVELVAKFPVVQAK